MRRKPKSDFSCYCLNLRLAMKHVKLVDKYLIIIMIILFVHVAIMLFIYEPNATAPSSIDTIIKSTAASIFGYFISANFIKVEDKPIHNNRDDHIISNSPFSSSLKTIMAATNDNSDAKETNFQIGNQPKQASVLSSEEEENDQQISLVENKIRFGTSSNHSDTIEENDETRISSMNYPASPVEESSSGRLQITIVSLISIISLILLIIARSMEAAPNDSVTISQLRDFICGGIGFLIGYPTNQ